MEHVGEMELIEYVAGRLDLSRFEAVAEHIGGCRACSGRCRDAAQMWDGLGQWKVETAGHDVAGRVIESVANTESGQDQSKVGPAGRVRFVSIALRVAASIIIAIGLGHKLGEYSVRPKVPSGVASGARPAYLAALGLEWSSELAWLVLENEPADEEEQG